jgi:hypothetical protein
MRRIVLVCNASVGIKEALERFRARFLSPSDYLSVFREASALAISSRIFGTYVSKSPVADYDTWAVVFVINSTDQELDSFRVELPGALFLKAPFRFARAHNKEYLQFVSFIQRELVHVRKLTNALKKEFRERDSRTPLLLPVRNFDSSILKELIVDVQKFRSAEDDYYVPLRALIDAKGLASVRETKKRTYFENERSLRFYGPSKAGARHGTPSYGAPHNCGCAINAYFRLGARYDVSFHYDCQYRDKHIGGKFPNCHDAEQHCPLATHLNISPNDFIR